VALSRVVRVLAWRDLAVRQKQTVITVAWAVIRLFLSMVVLTVIFGRIAKLRSDGSAPFFAGMLWWTFFATGLSEASNSLVNNPGLIQQGIFPAADRTDGDGDRCFCRLLDHLLDANRADGVVSVRAGMTDGGSARCVRRLGFSDQRRPRAVDYRAQCQVPRFPLCDPVHRTVRPLCLASRVQLERCTLKMAALIFAQSDGRRHRWLSLVHSRRTALALYARSGGERVGLGLFSVVRHPSLPPIRKELCRPDLSPPKP